MMTIDAIRMSSDEVAAQQEALLRIHYVLNNGMDYT